MQIVDESTENEDRHQLYLDGISGGPRILVTRKNGVIRFHWQVYGPQAMPEARELIQGFLEMMVLADKLEDE